MVFANLSLAATNYDLKAKVFVTQASNHYYQLYDKLSAETYASTEDESFATIFSRVTTVKTIAQELVEISKEAKQFNINKIQDPVLRRALEKLHYVGGLFILGDNYFESILITLNALKSLSTDKDIKPYDAAGSLAKGDSSPIAYDPDIERIFETSNDSKELKYYWETWRKRNAIWATMNCYIIIHAIRSAAELLDLPVMDFYYFNYMDVDITQEMDKVMEELKPTYLQLHAFVRHELKRKYNHDVTDVNGPIPDHLFQQVLAQAWKENSVIEEYFPYKELPPYDDLVRDFNGRDLLNKAEEFYKSLGFSPLEGDFIKSRLNEINSSDSNDAECHAHIFDSTPQVRMQYCKKVDFREFMQMHSHAARLHYAMEKKSLPSYFFDSYNLEYAVGEAIILSASSPRHLQSLGVLNDFKFSERAQMNRLFRMAIHTILNIPLYYVHTRIINELLKGSVEMDGVNRLYWKLMQEYVGVDPPMDREENAIDFPYKFYFEIETNYQSKKFVSEILGYQFYEALCQKARQTGILSNCDFYGNKAIGEILRSMMSMGSSKPWRDVISTVLNQRSSLTAGSLLEYYKPVIAWLKNFNNNNHIPIGWNETKRKIL
ncbi:angiotensin-converting enzyme-like [Musca vetustissima]|uniref:angiotensin-converting enzyme-like n=1 Tax=Musca vetustissima TaxID=27455 RepID=UPI002AB765E4|nr:angiotensin-converting enzyme-like [Musca vetustissima]